MTKSRANSGFSMVELLVVATIIGVLAAAGLVSYTTANRNARNAKRRSDLEQIRAALELYRSENPNYPATSSWSTMMSNISPYLSNSTSVNDPKPSPYPQYTYTNSGGGCTGYRLCADLEPTTNYDYCLCNP